MSSLSRSFHFSFLKALCSGIAHNTLTTTVVSVAHPVNRPVPDAIRGVLSVTYATLWRGRNPGDKLRPVPSGPMSTKDTTPKLVQFGASDLGLPRGELREHGASC